MTTFHSTSKSEFCLKTKPHKNNPRVAPTDPRPSGRESGQVFDFLGRELTFFRNSLLGLGREWKKETQCGPGLGSWDT